MQGHWHFSVENLLVYGVSAVVFMNLVRMVAGHMVASDNATIASIGKSMGALVHFGS